ncbi:MAG: lactonase family protein [Candidatus Acidiferrales bacterium]|jgi:6-phosphogluconolactonase
MNFPKKQFRRLATLKKACFPKTSAALFISLALVSGVGANAAPRGNSYFVYVGTYTHHASKGIYLYRFSPSTGEVRPLGLAAETASPAWLIVHPSHRFLYAANEYGGQGEAGNTITAYASNAQTGRLTFLNKVSSKGVGPCHLAIDKTGAILVAANFGSGSVAAFPIHRDGTLGEASGFDQHHGSSVDPLRQAGPHAHCVVISPDNRFVLAADIGLDRIFVYRLNVARGSLEPSNTPFVALHPGWGPRHLAFHPNGKVLYLISEMGSKLTTFDYDTAEGTLKEIQTISTLPEGFSGKSTAAEIQADRAGRFVYDSNRGDDSVGVFAIDGNNGRLSPVQFISTEGKTPRSFALDPTGEYLFAANQNSASIVLFRVDPATGRLTPAGTVLKDAPEPSSVVFVAGPTR